MVQCFVQKFSLHSPSSLGTLPVGSRVPPIAETSALITSPLLDERVFASVTRSILICQPEESPLLTSLTSKEIAAPQQDRASVESKLLPPQEPSTSTTDQHSVSENPVHQVEPVLGTTPSENR